MHHLSRSARGLAVLLTGVAAGAALWVAASPPPTTTVAPVGPVVPVALELS